MIEIRINGRGGQGGVTAAQLLAKAAFEDGSFSQAFPNFGPARRGAPVEAYCRIDDKFIDLRTQIYEPDYVIVLDPTLPKFIDVTKGLKKGGAVIINSKKKSDFKVKTYELDAAKIAQEELGRPIVNTTVLGAFSKVSGIVSLKALKKAIKEHFPKKLADVNLKAIERAYKEVSK